MFANEFQGGQSFEVFTVQGSHPLAKWRIHGPSHSVRKDFDKFAKSTVISLEGDPTQTKITLPKDDRQSLVLLQPVLVLQINVPVGQNFAVEVSVLDNGGQKRRFLLSSSYKFISVTALHVKVPLSSLERGNWVNLCLDLQSLTEDIFRGETFRCVDSVTICAACRLKKLYTLKQTPSGDDCKLFSSHSSASSFRSQFQLITLENLLNAGVKFKLASTSQLNSSSSKINGSSTHIAFGKRTSIPHHLNRQQSKSKDEPQETSSKTTTRNEDTKLILSSNRETYERECSPTESEKSMVHVPRPPATPPSRKTSASRVSEKGRSARQLSRDNTLEKDATEDVVIDKFHNATNDFSMPDTALSCSGTDLSILKSNHRYDFNNNKLQSSSSGYSSLKSNETSQEFEGNFPSKRANEEIQEQSTSNSLTPSLKMADDEVEEEYFKLRNSSRSEGKGETRRDSTTVAQLSNRSSGSSKMSCSEGSDSIFLYSSRPRSVGKSSRSRQLTDSSNSQRGHKSAPLEPENRRRPSQPISNPLASSAQEDDFHGESSDSDTETRKIIVDRPKSAVHMKQLEKIRQSIRSSMLREIEPPSQPVYNQNRYQSVDSDSMSWMYDSDSSTDTVHSTFEEPAPEALSAVTKTTATSGAATKTHLTVMTTHSHNNSGSASEDEMSTTSDDFSWKSPPLNIHNYRYQQEMNGLQMTLDLSATLPMTPFTEEQSLKDSLEIESNLSAGRKTKKTSSGEDLLDLLYDPVFKCYFDPVSQKYYELV